MQTLIIGDIHGCHAELSALLDLAGISSDDQIISLGDIVDRGHGTPDVLRYFQRSPNCRVLMGNHERKHVRSFRGEIAPSLSQQISRRQIGEDAYPSACEWMAGLPVSIELPDALLVHAMFEPGVALADQKESVLVGTMQGESHLRTKYCKPWYELYSGSVPVVVGHHNIGGNTEPYVRSDGLVIGLDTSCYDGGALSGLILPSFKLVSVPSRGRYWAELRALHSDLTEVRPEDGELPFERLESMLAREQRRKDSDSRRRIGLENLLEAAEEDVLRILRYIEAVHAEIMSQLQIGESYEGLDSKAQASAYARLIPDTRLAPMLHAYRRGEASTQSVRKHLRTPHAARQFAATLPVPAPSGNASK